MAFRRLFEEDQGTKPIPGGAFWAPVWGNGPLRCPSLDIGAMLTDVRLA